MKVRRILANLIVHDYDDARSCRHCANGRQKMAKVELDAIDRKILAILQVNGRLSKLLHVTVKLCGWVAKRKDRQTGQK